MPTRRQALAFISAAAAVAAVPLPVRAQTKLTLNSITPPTHFFSHTIMAEWVRRVAQATDGEVVIEPTAAPLGPMPRALDMVRTGVADVSAGNHGTIANRFPLTMAPVIPFMKSTPSKMAVALWRVHEKFLASANEHEGVKLLSLWVSGGFQFFSRQQLKSSGDLTGQRIITSSAMGGKITQALGATPVSAPVSEQYELLSRGVVDGTMTSQTGVTGWNLENIIKYQLQTPGGINFETFYLVMNLDKWNALPAAHQKAIAAVSGESFAKFAAGVFEEQDRLSGEKIRNAGVQIVTFDDAAQAAISDKLAFAEADWISMADQRGVDGAAAIRMLRREAAVDGA